MNGIEKEIDSLGRILIPIKIRHKLGLSENSKVLISMTSDGVFIKPSNASCAICGALIEKDKKLRLCNACIEKAKTTEQ